MASNQRGHNSSEGDPERIVEVFSDATKRSPPQRDLFLADEIERLKISGKRAPTEAALLHYFIFTGVAYG